MIERFHDNNFVFVRKISHAALSIWPFSKNLTVQEQRIMFHSTVVCLVAWSLNTSEAGGDLALIQTCLLFSFKEQKEQLEKHKAARSLSKQGHLQPRCHSNSRSLNRQL